MQKLANQRDDLNRQLRKARIEVNLPKSSSVSSSSGTTFTVIAGAPVTAAPVRKFDVKGIAY